MRLRKNAWIGETNARPPSVAATASLHYLQADDEPSNQTSLTQQIKTGLPKAAGNVKNIATEWLARQRQHRPSCTAKHFAFDIDLFKLIWPSAINSGLQHPQFRSQKLPHIWSHFWLRAIPFIFNSFANRKTFPASILNSQDGTSLAHPTNRIKKRGMIHGTNDSAESGQALSAKTIAKHDSRLNGKLLIATPWIVLYLINYITREKNYANIKSKRYLSTTGGDAELVSQNLAGSRCPFQPLFTKERRSAQVNESKQLLGQTRPPPPQFQWWRLEFQRHGLSGAAKPRCQQHWNWGAGLRNTGTSKLHSHHPVLKEQGATLDRVFKEGLKTLRLRIVKPRWNLGGTAAFCPYQ